jgi:hypothetical protein
MVDTYVGVLLAYLSGKTAWTLFWSAVAYRRAKKNRAAQQEQIAAVAEAFKKYQAEQQAPDEGVASANLGFEA